MPLAGAAVLWRSHARWQHFQQNVACISKPRLVTHPATVTTVLPGADILKDTQIEGADAGELAAYHKDPLI